ncbi:hypothetical protein [Microbacterium sp. NPDC058389]|uniref:hypothetical protein n=1 Tax=Microbacterium sp. NPDC058389 TaxID=3346475 RepID=UPI003658A980
MTTHDHTDPERDMVPARIVGPSGQILAELSVPVEALAAAAAHSVLDPWPTSPLEPWPQVRARLESALRKSMTAHGLDPQRSVSAVDASLDAFEAGWPGR